MDADDQPRSRTAAEPEPSISKGAQARQAAEARVSSRRTSKPSISKRSSRDCASVCLQATAITPVALDRAEEGRSQQDISNDAGSALWIRANSIRAICSKGAGPL